MPFKLLFNKSLVIPQRGVVTSIFIFSVLNPLNVASVSLNPIRLNSSSAENVDSMIEQLKSILSFSQILIPNNPVYWILPLAFSLTILIFSFLIIFSYFRKKTNRELNKHSLSESAFRSSEERAWALIGEAEILVSVFDVEGTCLMVNRTASNYYSMNSSELIGKSVSMLHPENAAVYLDRFKKATDSGIKCIYEDRVIFNDEPYWINSSFQPVKDRKGEHFAIQIVSRDITEKKFLELKLRESEERFQAVSDLTSDFAYAYDLMEDGSLKFKWVTGALVDITGYTIQEIQALENKWNDLIHKDDLTVVEKQMKELKTAKSSVVEYRIKRKDGSTVWLRDFARLIPRSHPSFQDSCRIIGAIADISNKRISKEALHTAFMDLERRADQRTKELKVINAQLREEISFRKAAEEKLLFAKRHAEQANKAKTEFLANISHELRTPMHHILNYSKYGITKFNKTSKERLLHYFKQIRITGDRLMILLNDLLDLSKLETGNMDYQFGKQDLQKIVGDRIAELEASFVAKKLTIQLDGSKADTILTCDGYKIGQVIQNILSNAIKFSAEGRSISISFQPSVLSVMDIDGQHQVVSALSTCVWDQGVGIPDRELETVFDKFVQSSKTRTGAGGTGLGLSISKEIVEAHNGVIYAENNSDGGASFTFTLPYDQTIESPPVKTDHTFDDKSFN